eukprot:g47493.t1
MKDWFDKTVTKVLLTGIRSASGNGSSSILSTSVPTSYQQAKFRFTYVLVKQRKKQGHVIPGLKFCETTARRKKRTVGAKARTLRRQSRNCSKTTTTTVAQGSSGRRESTSKKDTAERQERVKAAEEDRKGPDDVDDGAEKAAVAQQAGPLAVPLVAR